MIVGRQAEAWNVKLVRKARSVLVVMMIIRDDRRRDAWIAIAVMGIDNEKRSSVLRAFGGCLGAERR